MNTKLINPAGKGVLYPLLLAALCSYSSAALAANKTYTLDADFALGVLDGVNYDAPNSDQLQLNAVGTTFPVAWIANAGEDTVSKFDTNLNKEIARYRTWFGPAGQAGFYNHLGNAYDGAAPSRLPLLPGASTITVPLPYSSARASTSRSSFSPLA